MDLEDSKEEPVFYLNDSVGEPFVHQYYGLDCGQEQGHDDELDEDEEIPLQGMDEDRLHPMQALEAPFPPVTVIDLNDDSLGDFISYRDNPQMTSGHPSFFGNGLTHRRDVDMEHYKTHPSLNGDNNKRPRFDNPYNAESADDFDICMDQIQHWVGKARSMCAAKYQSFEESSMNEQILLNELHNRDTIIDQLRKELVDESQKGQRIVHRLEKELHMMMKLVEGYRESIRGTQKAFDEYRARSQQANEPYYKDVPGSKGLVMSVVEVEKKQQLK